MRFRSHTVVVSQSSFPGPPCFPVLGRCFIGIDCDTLRPAHMAYMYPYHPVPQILELGAACGALHTQPFIIFYFFLAGVHHMSCICYKLN